MAAKKGSNKLANLLLIGGIGVGFYLAWDMNILGFRDLFQQAVEKVEDIVVPETPYTGGSMPQAVHKGQYPFPYPYPPTTYPMTVAPTTQGAAHYRIAGTPNLGVMGAALMPNPSLWMNQGGISNPRSVLPGTGHIDYGPYKFDAPIFSSQRYGLRGTNIDYPFIVPGPPAPSPCPLGEYRAGDGRCYKMSAPPPENCSPGYYRASDGKCYFMGP